MVPQYLQHQRSAAMRLVNSSCLLLRTMLEVEPCPAVFLAIAK
jgi:hypothetical protein